MGNIGRQVEHIARIQNPVLCCGEMFKDSQLGALQAGVIEVLVEHPAPLSLSLYQEHVIGVQVGSESGPVR